MRFRRVGVAEQGESRSQRRGGPSREAGGVGEVVGPVGDWIGLVGRDRARPGKQVGLGGVGRALQGSRRCESGRNKWAGKDRAGKETDGQE